ncbi:nitrilase [Thermococcus gorgonarius]|uniref:Acyltransferase n=1 Tax=Thermococcus gorgonarius TaxID=71997 RepID=A0A2Z2MGC5_THEGO|nr:nitrilase [Thermococcus gorgonarius]ASJ00998.1 acyltransferase [Thermococcus gorgonarius]
MIRVAFGQMYPKLLEPEENYLKAESLIEKAAENGAKLIVLPELFDTGYNFENREEVESVAQPIPNGKTTRFLVKVAKKYSISIVAGTAEKDNLGRLYNSAVVVGPQGYVGKYRKIHLFAREKEFFEPGNLGFEVFQLGFARIGVMICFDWFFPESARTLALKGAEIIAHPANLVMPYAPRAMPIRALENRVYTITADRVGEERGLRFIGRSQINSPLAETLVEGSEDGEEVGTAEIDLSLARNKRLNDYNDIFRDRRPQYYAR